ncbi:hypothetical protein RRG08_042183 [Elysia crispata]|uniref:Uncharacterized protein n=1 Tax=Elysia crispata TaxID=231223 RepID=A0AAE0YGT1_9GAST|nr:hypothetical protein RRG08_042183 [Elysia crispata]
MEASKPNPKFLTLIERPTAQQLQDLMAGVLPRQSVAQDILGIVPEYDGDWEAIFRRLTKTTATYVRKSVSIAVEKIVRGSDEWKDIMAITDVPTPKKIDGTDFRIFVDHPQKGLLLEYTEYRKAVQQRASSTVSKDMKSLMECLKALNRSGNLQLILKAPDENRNRIRHIFRARVVNPIKNWVKREGNKAASGC